MLAPPLGMFVAQARTRNPSTFLVCQWERRDDANVSSKVDFQRRPIVLTTKTIVVCAALSLLAGPALAANAGGSDAAAAQRLVSQSATTIRHLDANPDFGRLLKQAKGVFIVPDLVKGALVVGGSGGTGVLIARVNGRWSDPAFESIGSISLGAQAGFKAGPVAMFLMTDRSVANFAQHNNFSFNGNANLTVVNWSPNAQGSIGKGDVIVWSGENGLFAGLDFSGSDVNADADYDRAYYNTRNANTKEILDGRLRNANAASILSALPS